MTRVLILAPFSPTHLEKLRRSADVTYESWLDSRRIYDPEALASRLINEGINILVIESDFVFEEVFERADCLRFVGICRNATRHVDIEAATRHTVAVVNTPSRNARAVAEHALGLMLSLARRISLSHGYVRGGRWRNPAEPYITLRGVELGGRTLGIIGLGSIGRTLAQMAVALGMRVLAHDPYIECVPGNVAKMDLDELMTESDFVSVHLPLNPETRGLIDARRISLMSADSYLVNTSEDAVVDQQALAEALTHERIAGAGVDVFDTHPVSPDNPLLGLDNVVLTPHLGGATRETVERHSAMMACDILRWLNGHRPINMVNPEVWERVG